MKKEEKLKIEIDKFKDTSIRYIKQQIAIEHFGPVFQDEEFFNLEMEYNSELAELIDKEYFKRIKTRILN